MTGETSVVEIVLRVQACFSHGDDFLTRKMVKRRWSLWLHGGGSIIRGHRISCLRGVACHGGFVRFSHRKDQDEKNHPSALLFFPVVSALC